MQPVTDANGQKGFYDESTGFIPVDSMQKVTSDTGEKGYYHQASGFIPAPSGESTQPLRRATDIPAAEPSKPGLGSKLAERAFDYADALTAPMPGKSQAERIPLRLFNAAGAVGGAITDTAMSGIESLYKTLVPDSTQQGISDAIKYLSGTDVGKAQLQTLASLGKAYETVKGKYPAETKVLESAGNILNATGIFQLGKMAAPAAREAVNITKDVGGAALRGTGKAMAGILPEDASQKLIASGAKWGTTLPPETRKALTDTMIQEKILLNPNGYAKLEGTVDGLNAQIKSALKPIADEPLDAQKVVSRISEAREKAAGTYDPESNLAKIAAEEEKFLGNWDGKLTVGKAQSVKQDIYKQLKKHYESIAKNGTALYSDGEIAAKKNIARGLKEEIEASAGDVPIKELNARESALLNLEPHLRRAVGRIENHNILSLDDVLAAGVGVAVGGPAGVAFGVAKRTLGSPSVKSRMAVAIDTLKNPAATPEMKSEALKTAQEMMRLTGPRAAKPLAPSIDAPLANPPVVSDTIRMGRNDAELNRLNKIRAEREAYAQEARRKGLPEDQIQAELDAQYGRTDLPPTQQTAPKSELQQALDEPGGYTATDAGVTDTALRISSAEREMQAQHDFIEKVRSVLAESGVPSPQSISDEQILRIAKAQGLDYRLGKQPGQPTKFAPVPSTDVRSGVTSGKPVIEDEITRILYDKTLTQKEKNKAIAEYVKRTKQ